MEQDSAVPAAANITIGNSEGEGALFNESNILINATAAIINTTIELLTSSDEEQSGSSYYIRFLGVHLDRFDYYHMQDRVISMMMFPFSYIYYEISLTAKIFAIIALIFIIGVLIPIFNATYKWIRAVCHPITFPHKHVLITGCASGLGKALV